MIRPALVKIIDEQNWQISIWYAFLTESSCTS
uniref:Uncharacterized protein n=1 Tax=Arundo donax TaxID=35708 RepID=A0A0A8YWF9_ARUDO